LNDESVIFADTANDRLVQVSADGVILRVIQGNIRLKTTERDFVALTAAYNSALGLIYIAFSQNVTIADTTKMYLVSDQQSIRFSDTGVSAVLSSPIDGKSATIAVALNSEINAIVDSWTGTLHVVLASGSVTTAGSSGSSSGGSSSGSGGSGGGGVAAASLDVRMFSDDPDSSYYEDLGAGSFDGTGTLVDGLTDYSSTDSSAGDFNGDGEITSTLQGPGGQSGTVTLNVYKGDVVYDNILGPMSIQVSSEGNWITANAHTDAIISYDSQSTRLWSVPSTSAAFTDGLGGSAYELDNGNLLIAIPAASGTNGALILLNRKAGNVPLCAIEVDGDAVRALPYSNMEFWVLVDDRTNGRTSRLCRINTAGTVTWSWGAGVLVHPTGLRLLDSGDILISE
jgi:hypothetical protein